MIGQKAGYTIVEMLIVLAVTGLISVSAFSLIRGQQSRTEFSQGLRNFDNQLTDISNDVGNGYFPSIGTGRRCMVIGGVPTFLITPAEQGTSADCIFIGKAVQFEPQGAPGTINVYTLVGRRLNSSGREVASITEASPRAVYGGTFDLTERQRLLWDLKIRSLSPSTGAVVFLTGFVGGYTGAGQSIIGNPATDLYYLSGSSLSQNPNTVVSLLSNPANYIRPSSSSGIKLCVEKDDTWATITYGLNNRKLTSTTKVLAASEVAGSC